MASASFATIKRVQKDVNLVLSNSTEGVQGELETEDDLSTLLFIIDGPKDSPFEGGKFRLRMVIPSDYPMRPPSCQFLTSMWHPNVYKDGKICLDTLQSNWAAGMNLITVVMTIVALLTNPNPADPANSAAGRDYNDRRRAYDDKVRTMAKQSQLEWAKWMEEKVTAAEPEPSSAPSAEITDEERAEIMAAIAAADAAEAAASASAAATEDPDGEDNDEVEETGPPRTKRPRAV